MNKMRRVFAKSREKGTVLISVAGMLAVFLGFAALVIDLGQLFLIRNQLQNAADAAALTGAGSLFPGTSSGPNWTLANTKATAAIFLNKVNNSTLTNGTIQTGYWDLTRTIPGIRTITPPTAPGANDAAAVKVTISKSTGNNGGPVNLIFGPILGLKTADVSVQAIAVAGSPGRVDAGTLFPMVLVSSLYSAYWDSATGKPKIDPATGKAYEFTINSAGNSGQWSSFLTDANDVPTIKNLITSGNPQSLSIGDMIWIEPGVKNTIYSSVPTNIDTMVAIVALRVIVFPSPNKVKITKFV